MARGRFDDPSGELNAIFTDRLVTVAPPSTGTLQLKADYESITEALNALPNVADNDFVHRYMILVTPGYYRERIKMKPWVNLVGVSKESVYLQPLAPWDVPQPRWERQTPREHVLSPGMADAIIELSNNCNITNLSILNPGWATSKNVAIRGRSVKGIGLTDLDVFPGSDWPDSPPVRAGGPFCRGRILELTGDSGMCIVTALGFTYLGPDSFAVKLEGIGQNADSHFICFFDALFVETTTSGCVQIRDCYDVHIRNSLLRVNNAHLGSVQEAPEVLGCAVDVAGAAQLAPIRK